jgi:hypothetical protein
VEKLTEERKRKDELLQQFNAANIGQKAEVGRNLISSIMDVFQTEKAMAMEKGTSPFSGMTTFGSDAARESLLSVSEEAKTVQEAQMSELLEIQKKAQEEMSNVKNLLQSILDKTPEAEQVIELPGQV